MLFSHVKPSDTEWKSDGLRDFFLYKDLGIATATNGEVVCHLVKANKPPIDGTGWHTHQLKYQIVYMMSGWARFMYNDIVTLIAAGDCVHQPPGLIHYLFDYSEDMIYMEICSPADFGTRVQHGMEGIKVPPVTPWKE